MLQKDGIVSYKRYVPPGDVRRYLFEGFARSFYPRVPFDSIPEKVFAAVLEDDGEVAKWIRPPDNNVPILWRGQNYTPDFLVETPDLKYMVEVKRRDELWPKMDEAVLQKARAAVRWCEAATGIPGAKPWQYKLVPDDVIDPTHSLGFILSKSVRVDSAASDSS